LPSVGSILKSCTRCDDLKPKYRNGMSETQAWSRRGHDLNCFEFWSFCRMMQSLVVVRQLFAYAISMLPSSAPNSRRDNVLQLPTKNFAKKTKLYAFAMQR